MFGFVTVVNATLRETTRSAKTTGGSASQQAAVKAVRVNPKR